MKHFGGQLKGKISDTPPTPGLGSCRARARPNCIKVKTIAAPHRVPAFLPAGDVERDKLRVMLKASADTTNKTYASSWKQWVNFSKVRQKSPFLLGGVKESLDEDELFTFAVYTTGVLNLSYSTMKSRLMAIRAHHLRAAC